MYYVYDRSQELLSLWQPCGVHARPPQVYNKIEFNSPQGSLENCSPQAFRRRHSWSPQEFATGARLRVKQLVRLRVKQKFAALPPQEAEKATQEREVEEEEARKRKKAEEGEKTKERKETKEGEEEEEV